MTVRYCEKLSLIALLVAAAVAPAWASDAALTTQQSAIGEAAMEMAASLEKMSGAQESSAAAHESAVIENSGRISPPEARLGGPREPAAPPPVAPRPSSATHRAPLILGIGY